MHTADLIRKVIDDFLLSEKEAMLNQIEIVFARKLSADEIVVASMAFFCGVKSSNVYHTMVHKVTKEAKDNL